MEQRNINSPSWTSIRAEGVHDISNRTRVFRNMKPKNGEAGTDLNGGALILTMDASIPNPSMPTTPTKIHRNSLPRTLTESAVKLTPETSSPSLSSKLHPFHPVPGPSL